MRPSSTTSRTIRYIMQRMPKTSHQRWGDVCRQVEMDVYSRICAVRNQLSVINDDISVKLEKFIKMSQKQGYVNIADREYALE